MPQNDYIERHVKLHGRRLDHEERARKKQAREGHRHSRDAQNLRGLRAKRQQEARRKEKIQMRKTIRAHEARNVKSSDAPPEDDENREAVPHYLLDRAGERNAKALSTAIKQKRNEKAARFAVPLPKVRGISEAEIFSVVKTGKKMKKKAWKRMITKPTFVGPDFVRGPVKLERFIRPMALRQKRANVTHPGLAVTVQLPILSVKKNPQDPMYTRLGVLTKGTIIEVNVSDLGMTTTSGKVVWGRWAQITTSKELLAQFNTLLGSDQHFGLLVTITGESLTPVDFLTPPSSSSASAFSSLVDSLLVPRLKEKEALYILLRRYDEAPRLVAATYVPDAAPVRQKMLFASTRLTLVRELGSEHFRETIFATTAEELSGRGFEKHDAHNALAAPLTEEERTLGDVKRAEQEAGHGTGSRDVHLSRGLKLTVQPDAVEALRSLNDGETLVILKINPETEVVELAPRVSPTPTSIEQLAQAISATEPRFTFFRFAHEYAGYKGSPLLFFYTCPATPGSRAIKFRMMYPLMKRAVLDVAEGQAGLTLEKKFEVDEPSEITEASVLGELHPKVEVRRGFSRPKRPGR